MNEGSKIHLTFQQVIQVPEQILHNDKTLLNLFDMTVNRYPLKGRTTSDAGVVKVNSLLAAMSAGVEALVLKHAAGS